MTRRIRTARLILRRWTESDRVPFAELNADREVMRYFPSTLDRAQSDSMIDRMEDHFDEHGFGLWAVEVDGRFAGFTGLNSTSFETPMGPHVEIGWRFAAWAWGHGYATEAASAALRAGFIDHQLREIYSFTTETNLRSEAVMVRIGMSRSTENDFDHPRTPGWWGRRHIVYRLTLHEWSSLTSIERPNARLGNRGGLR